MVPLRLLCSSALYVKEAEWVRRALVATAPEDYLHDQQLPGGDNPPNTPAALNGWEEGSSTSLAGASSSAGGKTACAVVAPPGETAEGSAPAPAAAQSPVDFKDFDVPFGHGRFRGLRLWFVLRLVSCPLPAAECCARVV